MRGELVYAPPKDNRITASQVRNEKLRKLLGIRPKKRKEQRRREEEQWGVKFVPEN